MRWIEKDFLTKSGSNKWIATIIRNILKTFLILLGRYLNHLPIWPRKYEAQSQRFYFAIK